MAKKKKTIAKCYLLQDSIYITFLKWRIYECLPEVEKGDPGNSSCLDTKTRQRQYKNSQTNKHCGTISHESRCKSPQQNVSKCNPMYIKEIIQQDQVGFCSGMQD